MVNRGDIRRINGIVNGSGEDIELGLIEALDILEEIEAESEKYGADPTDHPDFQEAHHCVKECIAKLIHHSDDMIDRSGVLEDDEGNTVIDLPEPALKRTQGSEGLPELPSDSDTN